MDGRLMEYGYGGWMNDRGWTEGWTIGLWMKDGRRIYRRWMKDGWTDDRWMEDGWMDEWKDDGWGMVGWWVGG